MNKKESRYITALNAQKAKAKKKPSIPAKPIVEQAISAKLDLKAEKENTPEINQEMKKCNPAAAE